MRRLILILTMVMLALPVAAKQRVAHGFPGPAAAVRIAGLRSHVWLPPGTGTAPLVLFSHGYGGCGTQVQFLTRALARAGYIVVAPDHRDALCDHGHGAWPAAPFLRPARWSEASYADRRDDLRAVLAALHRQDGWAARIDWAHVALIGHSLGGYAVLGMAGAWPGWKTGGIAAVVALSPYCAPFVAAGTLGGIDVPVLYEGGNRDLLDTPVVTRAGGCFARTPAPAFYVEFQGATHFAWTDLNRDDPTRAAIVARTLAFLDLELKGRGSASAVTLGPRLSAVMTR